MGLLEPHPRITITTDTTFERKDAWNKVTPINGLPRELPYPKIMRQTDKFSNIVFAIGEGNGIVLRHALYRTGFIVNLDDTEFYDYDGVILDEWLPIIKERCRMIDIPHFNKYDTPSERMEILKNIKHKDGTAYVTRLEHESYKLYHEYHND